MAVPETAQTELVVEAKLTVSPELALAASVTEPEPRDKLFRDAKAIVCPVSSVTDPLPAVIGIGTPLGFVPLTLDSANG
jgi:hypothetical protein